MASPSTTSTPSAPIENDAANLDSETSSGLSTRAQAGIGAACGLFGLAAVLALALLLVRRHKKRQERAARKHSDRVRRSRRAARAERAALKAQEQEVLEGRESGRSGEASGGGLGYVELGMDTTRLGFDDGSRRDRR